MTDEKFTESLRNLIEEYMMSHISYTSYRDFLNKNAYQDDIETLDRKQKYVCACLDHASKLIDDVRQSMWDT